MVLVLLTTVLSVVSIFYSFDPIQTRVKEHHATMLLLMIGMLGVFVSLDLPLLRLLGAQPHPDVPPDRDLGRPRRIYATVKFVVYTLVGRC